MKAPTELTVRQPNPNPVRSYLGDRREGYLFQNDRPRQKLRVAKAKPNKDESGVWWHGAWSEYPHDAGPLVTKWKWLGRVSEMSRKQAQASLMAARLATIKRQYERDNPEAQIDRQIDRLTSRFRSAEALLGEGDK